MNGVITELTSDVVYGDMCSFAAVLDYMVGFSCPDDLHSFLPSSGVHPFFLPFMSTAAKAPLLKAGGHASVSKT